MKKEDLMNIEGMTDELAEKVAAQSADELKGYIQTQRWRQRQEQQ